MSATAIAPQREARPAALGRAVRGALDARMIVLAAIGLGLGLSAFAFGFYDLSVWAPLALGVLAAVVALALAGERLPAGPGRVALGGLVAVWLWSLASRGWAEAAGDALTEADRWALYAAFLALMLLLIRRPRHGAAVLGAASAGVLVVALDVAIRMAAGDGAGLFLLGRLNGPLGYVNGEAGLFVLGAWPLVALAQRGHRVWAPLAVAGTTLLLGLVVLSQSRGAAIALVVSALVVLAAFPGRRALAWVLIAAVGGTATALQPLLHVYREGDAGRPIAAAVQTAGGRVLLAAALAGVVTAAVLWIASSGEPGRRAVRAGGRLLAVVLAIGAVAAAIAEGPRAVREVRSQVHAFVHLGSGTNGSRFLSGSGNRYDFWRVAWREFQANPVAGLGAGGYDRDYFRLRQTTEDVRQPHSLELQALAETGLVGALLLAIAIGALLVALVIRARARCTGVALAAGGVLVAWLAYTSVDWLHLLPGVTGIALASGAALCVPADRPARRGPLGLGVIVAGVVLAAVAAVTIARPMLALHEQTQARALLDRSPEQALAKANASLRLDGDTPASYYVKSAAYARLDDYRDARATLRLAVAREPHNPVPWVLLGDLATRRRDRAQARAAYARAHALNPRDPSLAALARGRRTR